MEELGLFSRISKLCFYLGAAVSCLILTYSQLIPVNSVLAAVTYLLLLLFTVLTQVANVYIYFREPHIENLWLKGATLKTKIRKYLLSAKPYLFFAFGLAAIFFLWLAFVYFHKLAKLVMGDLSYMFEISGHKVPWTILLLLPLYFLFDKADVIFKRFGDFSR